MTITLEPQQEARLIAAAEAKGISADVYVREAVERRIAELPLSEAISKVDTRPIWEIFLGNIEDVPAEAWEDLPIDGASEHDHYLYGSAKRHL